MYKKLYGAGSIQENGKYYAWVIPFNSTDNVKAIINRNNLETLMIFRKRTDAEMVVKSWNDGWINSGNHLFFGPGNPF